MSKQNKKGQFLSTKSSTNMHPHCYSLEGYWSWKIFKNKKYNFAAQKDYWLLQSINLEGFPKLKLKNQFNYFERVDILSQTLRLIILHQKQLKLKNKDKTKILKLIQNILNYQKLGLKNIKIKGGFYWGRKSNGEKTSHLNTWVTAFAIQALTILINKKSRKVLETNPFFLV